MRSMFGIHGDKKETAFGSTKFLVELTASREIDICIPSTTEQHELIVNIKREPGSEGAEALHGDSEDGTSNSGRYGQSPRPGCHRECPVRDIKREAEVWSELQHVRGLKEEHAQESDEETETGLSFTAEDEDPLRGVELRRDLTSSGYVSRRPKVLELEIDELKANICKYINTRSGAESSYGGASDPTADDTQSVEAEPQSMSAADAGCDTCTSKICRCQFPVGALLQPRVKTGTDKPFKCSVCNIQFTAKRNLQAHLGKVHAGDKPFSCNICNRKFTQKRGLQVHVKVYHTGAKPFICDVCKRPFSLKSNLLSHLKLHTNERPFECNICQKNFAVKKNLQTHLRIHTDEKLSCGICLRKFRQHSSLRDHLRMHTGEKPYSCDICQRKFTRRNVLYRHVRIHAIEKPFSCGICQRKFLKESALQVHLITHTDEKPFSCYFCPRKFSFNHYLTVHLRIHTGEKPFSCNICEDKFSGRKTLNAHLRSHNIT